MSEVVLNLKLQEKSSLATFGNIIIYMDAYEAKQKYKNNLKPNLSF